MDTLAPFLVGGHASSSIIAGHYAGLWSVLHKHGEKKWSLEEFAAASNCKERWIREWVGAMTSCGILTLGEGYVFECKPAVAEALLPTSQHLNMFTSLEFMMDKEPQIGACFKKDGPMGCGYDTYPNFQPWMASWTDNRNSDVDFPTAYFDQIGNGLHEALEKGIEVIEAGCGKGRHMLAVAKKYPNSKFLAFDISSEVIAQNKKEFASAGLKNVTFEVADFTAMPAKWNAKFDYMMIYDCMHDLPHPDKAMAGIKRVLKPNSLCSMLDINTSSDMLKQTQNPVSTVLYNISLHHCMSVSLASGGVGLGTCWGTELAQKMLVEAGFSAENITVKPDGLHVAYIIKNGAGFSDPPKPEKKSSRKMRREPAPGGE